MKRISWTVVVLIVTLAGFSTARSFQNLERYRVRYSPQAFGIDHSGLIPGRATYDPQAFGIDNKGFIPDYYHYNPYAFGLKSNGLIPEYTGCSSWDSLAQPNDRIPAPCHRVPVAQLEAESQLVSTPPMQMAPPVRNRVIYWTASYKRDPIAAVKNHLKNTLPGKFQISNLCTIDHELVTFDVLLPQYNLTIKVWNPKLLAYLKQQGDHRYRKIVQYLKRWFHFETQWKADGVSIQHIASNDTDYILLELQQMINKAQD